MPWNIKTACAVVLAFAAVGAGTVTGPLPGLIDGVCAAPPTTRLSVRPWRAVLLRLRRTHRPQRPGGNARQNGACRDLHFRLQPQSAEAGAALTCRVAE